MPTLHQRLGPLRQVARGVEAALWADDILLCFERIRRHILEDGPEMDAFVMEQALREYIDAAILLARTLHPLRFARPDLKLPETKRTDDSKLAIGVAERFREKRSTMESEPESCGDEDLNTYLFWGDVLDIREDNEP